MSSPTLSSAEVRKLAEWNDTTRELSGPSFLHQRFEDQAKRTPDAVAVRIGDAELSYRKLDERATSLAHYLRGRGVGPDVLVGICAERSFEMVVALYGVLKAGGAYVPLDPSYPSERLAAMLDDLGEGLLLTQAHLVSRLPKSRASAVLVDRDWTTIAQTAPQPIPVLSTSNLAYVIYTSGSTGRPNGAMNSHAGIVNRISWMQAAYDLRAGDVVLQKTPFSFDVSVWELFWPLAIGARLVLARPDGHKDPSYLRDLIASERVSTLHFVPSMLTAFLEAPGLEESCGSLRMVMASGEALPRPIVEKFHARLGSAELHNLYGPTEAAVDVTFYACAANDKRAAVPIGRPIANVAMYVLDEALQQAPIGAQGQLFIGGVGLGRGYHLRPGLTADRFVPSPFGQPGARIYRTGDLGRYADDGEIEYLGRADYQVKLRGFRIELGEIETAVRAQPGVREVVVVVRSDHAGNQRLVAYYSGDAEARSLRLALRERLPEHMVPALFVVLPTLPLSPNGKIDRKALPAPEGRPPLDQPLVEPRDDLERELAKIWEEELDVRPVGVTDSFFELGGYSLLAVRIVGRIAKSRGVTLPIAALLEHDTVEKLARHLVANKNDASFSPLVLLHAGRSRPLFLIHPIGGNVFCYVELSRLLGDDQTVYGLQQVGLDGKEGPQPSVVEQARTYVELVRSVQPKGPYLVGGFSYGGTIAVEMAQQLRQAGEEIALLLNIDARTGDAAMRAKAGEVNRHHSPAMFSFIFTVVMNRIAGIETQRVLQDFEGLDDDALIALIYREVQHKEAGDDIAGLAQIAIAYRLFVSNLTALFDWVPPEYAGVMTLVRATVPVQPVPTRPTPPPWSWELYCKRIETIDVPTTHFMLLHPRNVHRLADLIREPLRRARDHR